MGLLASGELTFQPADPRESGLTATDSGAYFSLPFASPVSHRDVHSAPALEQSVLEGGLAKRNPLPVKPAAPEWSGAGGAPFRLRLTPSSQLLPSAYTSSNRVTSDSISSSNWTLDKLPSHHSFNRTDLC